MSASEIGYADSDGAAARLRRRMVERVLTHCETDGRSAEPLLILLRRFATRIRPRGSAPVLRGAGGGRCDRAGRTTI